MISSRIYSYESDLVLEGDSLSSIAKRNIHKVINRYNDIKEYKEKIKEWNPRITEWNPPEPYQYILVDYPYDLPKYVINNKIYTPKIGMLFSDDIGDKTYSYFLTLTNSIGSYTESINDENIKSTQNFPLTIGASFSLKPENINHVIISSFYWAFSSDALIKTRDNETLKLKIPGEFGFNLYCQKFLPSYFGIYAGIDHERLNIFNTSDVISGFEIEASKSDLVYVTGGLSKNIIAANIPMGIKASFSKSIYEKSKVNDLKGSKYIFFFSFRPFGKFNFNVFYKHHDLNGITNLKIDRIGIGISFQL